MNVTVNPGRVDGAVAVPGSKSHTIRALLVAALAEGESVITAPLDSGDTRSCLALIRQLGVEVTERRGPGPHAPAAGRSGPVFHAAEEIEFQVRGLGLGLRTPLHEIDCGNSGTTLYLALSVAALLEFPVTFDGDEQLRRRGAGQLLSALESMGATITRRGVGDCVPLTVTGPLRGGSVTILCPTSQYLSSLLIAAPLTPAGMDISVPLLNERPYVEMTLGWLASQGIDVVRDGWSRFTVPGGRRYRPFRRAIPADFSSATFLLVAAAVTGSRLFLGGLDMDDTQGDKEVVTILERLGCSVERRPDGLLIAGPAPGEGLSGGEFDLNPIPDALPALAVAGTCCSQPLRLVNVPQAREKETDRISIMADAINRLGGRAEELPDGLVVHPRRLAGGTVDSAGDHRVAMALAVGGLCSDGPVMITRAEVASITYPGFYQTLEACGVRLARS